MRQTRQATGQGQKRSTFLSAPHAWSTPSGTPSRALQHVQLSTSSLSARKQVRSSALTPAPTTLLAGVGLAQAALAECEVRSSFCCRGKQVPQLLHGDQSRGSNTFVLAGKAALSRPKFALSLWGHFKANLRREWTWMGRVTHVW